MQRREQVVYLYHRLEAAHRASVAPANEAREVRSDSVTRGAPDAWQKTGCVSLAALSGSLACKFVLLLQRSVAPI